MLFGENANSSISAQASEERRPVRERGGGSFVVFACELGITPSPSGAISSSGATCAAAQAGFLKM